MFSPRLHCSLIQIESTWQINHQPQEGRPRAAAGALLEPKACSVAIVGCLRQLPYRVWA